LANQYNYDKNSILLLQNGVNKIFLKDITQTYTKNINITYIGGIDKVHGLEFLIYLANSLKKENIVFNIFGDGKNRTNLENIAKSLELENIIWHGSIPKTQVPEKLSEANLLFVSTSNVNYGSENKLYEYMAVGKPIVSAVSSSHNDPVSTINCGVSLYRDSIELSSKRLIEFIKTQKEQFKVLGKNGQNYVKENRTISILANKLEEILY